MHSILKIDKDKAIEFMDVVERMHFISELDAIKFDHLKKLLGYGDYEEYKLIDAIEIMQTFANHINSFFMEDEDDIANVVEDITEEEMQVIDEILSLLGLPNCSDINSIMEN